MATEVKRTPWWRRWWMIVIWGIIGLGLIVGVCNGIAASGGGSGSGGNQPSKPVLFGDASDGILQFKGGNTIPVGSYHFDCSRIGNVSVQIGAAPYTVSVLGGDQDRDIKQGDLVTVGWCKIYGPQ